MGQQGLRQSGIPSLISIAVLGLLLILILSYRRTILPRILKAAAPI